MPVSRPSGVSTRWDDWTPSVTGRLMTGEFVVVIDWYSDDQAYFYALSRFGLCWIRKSAFEDVLT